MLFHFNREIDAILAGKLDYKQFFRKTESGFNVDQFATFNVPDKFHDRVSRVIEKFRQEARQSTPAGQPQKTPY